VLQNIYGVYIMGIVKISDGIHEEVRKSSQVMSRSINAQAEFWMKMGRLAELNPTLSFSEIIAKELANASNETPLKIVK
jgi:hypothetical protein